MIRKIRAIIWWLTSKGEPRYQDVPYVGRDGSLRTSKDVSRP